MKVLSSSKVIEVRKINKNVSELVLKTGLIILTLYVVHLPQKIYIRYEKVR